MQGDVWTKHTHIHINISKCDVCRALHICRDQVDNICPSHNKNGHLIASSQNRCRKYRTTFKLNMQCFNANIFHTHTLTQCVQFIYFIKRYMSLWVQYFCALTMLNTNGNNNQFSAKFLAYFPILQINFTCCICEMHNKMLLKSTNATL